MRYLATILLFFLYVSQAWGVVLIQRGGGAPESPIWHWDASGNGSGTIIVGQETTTITELGTVSYASDGISGKGAEFVTATSYVRFTGWTNYPTTSGRVEFWFKDTLAGDLSYATIFSVYTGHTRVQRYGTSTTALRVMTCGSGNWNVDVGVNIFDGDGHTVVFSWDDTTDTLKVQIDGGSVITSTGMTLDCSSSSAPYFTVGEYDGDPIPGGIVDEVKIYDTSL